MFFIALRMLSRICGMLYQFVHSVWQSDRVTLCKQKHWDLHLPSYVCSLMARYVKRLVHVFRFVLNLTYNFCHMCYYIMGKEGDMFHMFYHMLTTCLTEWYPFIENSCNFRLLEIVFISEFPVKSLSYATSLVVMKEVINIVTSILVLKEASSCVIHFGILYWVLSSFSQ